MFHRAVSPALVVLVLVAGVAPRMFATQAGAAATGTASNAEQIAKGLWAYETLGREGGTFAKLNGLFVFHDGWFVQQSLNDGEPFDRQLAQAHAGPYRVEGDKIHMTAQVGLVVNPTRDPSVQSRTDGQHVVTPSRSGDSMRLLFGSGTIQTFRRVVGPGEGRVYPLDRGALALVDGHFILVAQNGDAAAAGSGRFQRQGNTLRLDAERWFTVRGGKASVSRGAIQATFDEQKLSLPEGLSFSVAK